MFANCNFFSAASHKYGTNVLSTILIRFLYEFPGFVLFHLEKKMDYNMKIKQTKPKYCDVRESVSKKIEHRIESGDLRFSRYWQRNVYAKLQSVFFYCLYI